MLFPNGKASVLPHIFISMSFKGEVHFVSSFPLFSSQIHRPQTTKRLSSDSSNNRGMLTDQHCPEPLLLQLLIHPGWEKGFLSQNVFQNSEQTKRKCLDIMKIWPFSTLKGFFHLLWKEGAFLRLKSHHPLNECPSHFQKDGIRQAWTTDSIWRREQQEAASFPCFPGTRFCCCPDLPTNCFYQKHLEETRSWPSDPAVAMSSNPWWCFFAEFSLVVKLPLT